MYGTVGTVKVKAGRGDDLRKIFQEWNRDFGPKVEGVVGSLIYKLDSDPNTWIMCGVFSSKALYQANADSPDQDAWYQRMRECLEADPEWADGEVLESSF